MKPKLYLFPAGFALTLALLATGCSQKLAQSSPPPTSVTVAPVEQKEIVEWIDTLQKNNTPPAIISADNHPTIKRILKQVRHPLTTYSKPDSQDIHCLLL